MAVEIVDGPLTVKAVSKPRYRTVRKDGKSFRVRVVSADSPSFGSEFQSAFAANVRRARAENRQLDSDD
ncbi:MAG: hypothetical protein CL680_08880 [Blastomonas sp.]|jgi:hypothetical protein|nr:hypothetical protein [Blastomonas sp.]